MAVPDFTGFTGDTLGFLAGLRANNTREWFAANKAAYERSMKKPAQAFAQLMAAELERLTGEPHTAKIFRVNRDLRFSKDKTPYNAHLHLSWTPARAAPDAPAFMFGLAPDYCTLGCGVFAFSEPGLAAWRADLAGARGDETRHMIDLLVAQGCRLQDPALKRVPAGFSADHPNARLALHKGVVAWRDQQGPETATQPGIMARCLEDFTILLPLWRHVATLNHH